MAASTEELVSLSLLGPASPGGLVSLNGCGVCHQRSGFNLNIRAALRLACRRRSSKRTLKMKAYSLLRGPLVSSAILGLGNGRNGCRSTSRLPRRTRLGRRLSLRSHRRVKIYNSNFSCTEVRKLTSRMTTGVISSNFRVPYASLQSFRPVWDPNAFICIVGLVMSD